MPRINTVASFAEIEDEFAARIRQIVWCNVATVDRHSRPRSRVLHPIWQGRTGWIATFAHSPKARDLARNPHVSLAYVGAFRGADSVYPCYADCSATWIDDLAEKHRIWDLFRTVPAPLGYDPAPTFGSYDHPNFGLLELTSWRIEVATSPAVSRVWQQAE